MQVVLLAGGRGTRLSEETSVIPKPMVTIGDFPILVHIMSHYASFGHKDFIIALGYKGNVIKEYFRNFSEIIGDFKIDTKSKSLTNLCENYIDWNITLIDTGLDTPTGGRLLRLNKYLDDQFLLTYGDGLSDVNIDDLIELHESQNRTATVTAVTPPARFGALTIEKERVVSFHEKIKSENDWINGGYFVMRKKFLNYIGNEDMPLEEIPLANAAMENELTSFKHNGFWQPMDTLRDKKVLEEIWNSGNIPWNWIIGN